MELENIPLPSEPSESQITNEKCAICLQIINRTRSYTSQCFHQFCFECILQWSAIKLSCPLCKTPFDRILFNIKSCVQYKQFDVKPINTSIQSTNPALDVIDLQANTTNTAEIQTYNEVKNSNISKASWLVNKEQAPLEFRILIYANKWYACPSQICYQMKIIELNQEFISNETTQQQTEDDLNRTILTEIQNSIDSDLLYLISYRQVKSFRNTKPEFYKQNVACTHRLIQFIYRELKAIACVMSSSKLPISSGIYLNQATRQKLIQLIINELKRNPIKSEEFLMFLCEYIKPIELAKHFAHELYVYCSSTSNSLVDYDAKSVYYPSLESANKEFNTRLNNQPTLPLPVLLNKYRLNVKPNETSNVLEINRNDPILVSEDNEEEETVTPNYNYVELNEDVDSTSESEQSSYCEYVEPSPRSSPVYIHLSSSSETELAPTRRMSRKNSTSRHVNRSRTTSSRSSSREKIKKKRKKHKLRSVSRDRSSRSVKKESDVVLPSTSQRYRSRSRKKKDRKKKKSKHKHLSKSKHHKKKKDKNRS